jgi:hypothetical protein
MHEGLLSETAVVIYERTRRLIARDFNLYQYCCQKLESRIISF